MRTEEMTAVDSSTISHLHHDPQTQVCTVRFKTGNLYTYSPMTAEDYKEFKTAKSVGHHFSEFIRNNQRFKVTPLGSADDDKPKQADSENDDDGKLAVA